MRLLISSWLALRQFRLKLQSEKVEQDIKLTKTFSEIMNIANGRKDEILSEKYIEKLFEKGIISKDNYDKIIKTPDFAIFTIPVGSAAQDAAIASIASLGKRHEVLKDSAIQGLESLRDQIRKKALIENHLINLKKGKTYNFFRKFKILT
jgi:hypothetical protein